MTPLKDAKQALPDNSWLLAGINLLPDTSLLVVADDRTGLVVVGGQSLLKSTLVVIAALNKRLASDIVSHVRLWWVENLVVGAAGCRVDQTACNSCDKELVVDVQFNGVLERLFHRLKHRVEALGLGNSAREAVEDESGCFSNVGIVVVGFSSSAPVLALLVVLKLALDHANDNLVADEATLVHDLLGLSSELRLLCDLGAQHVTGSLEVE